MLTQLAKGLPKKFDTASYAPKVVQPNVRLATALQTPAIPVTSCRYRIKPNRYPLIWVKEQLEKRKDRPVTLTLNQYLSKQRGNEVHLFHNPITKRFANKPHVFNPFVKVDPEVTQEAWETMEYFWAQKAHGKSGQAGASAEQIQKELLELQAKQEARRLQRQNRVEAALTAAQLERQEERKARISAKKEKARSAREEQNKQDDDDYDEPEPSQTSSSSKSAEFVF